MLRLPTYEDLSKEQDEILDLPLDANHLIIGPPGTGKTVMAIHRARMLHEKRGEPTLILMYNKLLCTYTSAAIEGLGIEGIATTYHKWFPNFFKEAYGIAPPKIDRYTFDWEACLKVIVSNPIPPKKKYHLLVDEGQDMPKAFFILLPHIAQTLTVFADENQSITPDQSTIADIKSATGITEVHTLTLNYRNTLPIAKLAASFHVGIQTGIAKVADTGRGGSLPVLDADENISSAVTRLVNLESSRSNEPIGVLVFKKEIQKKLYNRLLGKTRRTPQIYSSDEEVMRDREAVDWTKPGIKIVAYQSAKGLEFNTVILPEFQAYTFPPDSLAFRMMLYVLVSRARKELFITYSGDGTPASLNKFDMTLLDDRR